MSKVLRRGWLGFLIFVTALTVANFVLHLIEAGKFDRRAAILKAQQYRGEIIRDSFGVVSAAALVGLHWHRPRLQHDAPCCFVWPVCASSPARSSSPPRPP